jgi:hypothetical protein
MNSHFYNVVIIRQGAYPPILLLSPSSFVLTLIGSYEYNVIKTYSGPRFALKTMLLLES